VSENGHCKSSTHKSYIPAVSDVTLHCSLSERIPSVHMIDPMHFDRVSHDDVVNKWGVSSEKLGDVLALAGDSSDNIPGAPGIGPKIAASLIEEYGSLERLIEQAGNIKQKKRKESLVENADKVRDISVAE
jgi:DNA polymerase-1